MACGTNRWLGGHTLGPAWPSVVALTDSSISQARVRNDGRGARGRFLLPLEMTGKSIRLDVIPPGLLGIKSLGYSDVLKVLVVSPNHGRKFGPLQRVPAFFQGQLDR